MSPLGKTKPLRLQRLTTVSTVDVCLAMPLRLSGRRHWVCHASGVCRCVAYARGVAMSFRSRVEHACYPSVERLRAVPRPVAIGAFAALLAMGVLAPRPW